MRSIALFKANASAGILLIVALFLSVSLVLIPSAPAQAGGPSAPTPPPISSGGTPDRSEGGTGGTLPGKPTKPNPGTGTGGGKPKPPGGNVISIPGMGEVPFSWKYFSTTLYVTDGNSYPGCSPNDLGDGAIGGTTTGSWHTISDLYAVIGTGSTVRGLINSGQLTLAQKFMVSSSLKCIYPARWVIEQAKYECVIDSTAEVQQHAPRSRTLQTAGMTSSWGQGARTIDACLSSATEVQIQGTSPEYGRYSAQARTRVQAANVKTYVTADPRTGAVPAPEIHSVGAIHTINPAQARWQLTCAGFTLGWNGNPAFNQTECGPGQTHNPVKYQCTIDGDKNPLVNGTHTNNATIFRDGDPNEISWSRPSITGTANGVPEGKTQIIRSGTPWNTTSQFPTTKTNDVELYRDGKSKFTSVGGTGWMNKIMADNWVFKAYWASDTGKPTLLTPQFKWMANWVIDSQTVTSIHPLTGALTTAPITQTITAEALCVGTPLTINIVRATTGTG